MRRILAALATPTVALLCMTSDAFGQSGTNSAVLSDSAVEIRFAPPEDGLGCAGIVNRLVADERFVDPRPQGVFYSCHISCDFSKPRRNSLRRS